MCLSPVHLYKFVDNKRVYYDVPCGKCVECKSRRRNDYVVKCYNEFMNCSSAHFITLTYNDEHVPWVIDSSSGEIHLTLDIKDFQSCIKRCRRSYFFRHKENFDCRYMICGEYGSETHRPHYHLLVFNWQSEFLELFLRDWQKYFGFTSCKQVGMTNKDFYKSSLYVSKYVVKKDFDEKLIDYAEVVKNFKGRKMFVSTSHQFGHQFDYDFLFHCNFDDFNSLSDLWNNFIFWHINIFGRQYKIPLSIVDKLTELYYDKIFEKLHLENEVKVCRFDWYVFARLLSRIGFNNFNKERYERYKNSKASEEFVKLCSIFEQENLCRAKILSERFRFAESNATI